MNQQNNPSGVFCSLHPSEVIQRVNLEEYADKELYCLECILQEENTAISAELKTIPKLIEMAAELYTRSKVPMKLDSKIPDEYLNFTSNQSKKLESLSKHIEEEKNKTNHFFNVLSENIFKELMNTKNQYLDKLDQQLLNLRYWYIYFDKQVKKAYPSEDDIPFLYPSKEDLKNKLEKITNVTQLSAFVKSLKEDINEKKIPKRLGNKDKVLQELSEELKRVENLMPFYQQAEQNFCEFQKKVKDEISKLLKENFNLENSIQDAFKGANFGSNIIYTADLALIQSWLPNGISCNPKLLYRASRDGKEGKDFHKLCDGVENTLTLVKAEFSDSKTPVIIGGFLDKEWHSNTAFIESELAFLFSVTSKVKCDTTIPSYSAYGIHNQGPSFGGGYDLGIFKDKSNECYTLPNSFKNSTQLTPHNKSGLQYFTALEVEVFELVQETSEDQEI